MASPVHVLDDYYLAITLLVTVAYQLAFFSVAFAFKFDKLTDFAGGTNFALLAALTLALNGQPDARQLTASLLLAAWALRLAGFLLYRVLRTGRDERFDGTRERFFPFLGFWAFQMVWVWAVSLPVTVLNSPAVRSSSVGDRDAKFGTAGLDVAGLVLFSVGFVVESVADAQKLAFRLRHRGPGTTSPGTGGTEAGTGTETENGMTSGSMAFCHTGLFAWSRHPNYFGEILVQFSIYLLAISPATQSLVRGPPAAALYATAVGPTLLTALLLFVSGLPLSERPAAARRHASGDAAVWDAYARYLARTSVLIPLPPALYVRAPTWLRRTVLLEFPMYVFDPAKHAPASEEEEEGDDGVGKGGRRAVEEDGGGREGERERERDGRKGKPRLEEQLSSERLVGGT